MSMQSLCLWSCLAFACCAVTAQELIDPLDPASDASGPLLSPTPVGESLVDESDLHVGSAAQSLPYCECEPCCDCECGSRAKFTFRGGMDYFNVNGDSLAGGLYGADLAYALGSEWSFWGSAHASHFSRGTQFLGSIGLMKLPNLYGCDLASRTMVSVVFDQFTDSRVNDLYLSRLRVQLGYTTCSGLDVGLVYLENVSDDDNVNFLVRNFGIITPGTLRHARQFTAYMGRDIGCTSWHGTVGYSDETNQFSLGASIRAPLIGRVGTFGNANYLTDSGSWAATVGFEIPLGPRVGGGSPLPYLADAGGGGTVVRGQDPEPQLPLIVPNLSTTVSTPDGGTVLLGGVRRLVEPGRTHLNVMRNQGMPSTFWSQLFVARLEDQLAFQFDTVILGTSFQAIEE